MLRELRGRERENIVQDDKKEVGDVCSFEETYLYLNRRKSVENTKQGIDDQISIPTR